MLEYVVDGKKFMKIMSLLLSVVMLTFSVQADAKRLGGGVLWVSSLVLSANVKRLARLLKMRPQHPLQSLHLLHLLCSNRVDLGVRCWVAWLLAWAWHGWPIPWALAQSLGSS
jgi:hypothetical protein